MMIGLSIVALSILGIQKLNKVQTEYCSIVERDEYCQHFNFEGKYLYYLYSYNGCISISLQSMLAQDHKMLVRRRQHDATEGLAHLMESLSENLPVRNRMHGYKLILYSVNTVEQA